MNKIKIIKCPHCGSEFITNDFGLAKKSGYYSCGECGLCFSVWNNKNHEVIKSKDLVIWVENSKVTTWKPIRTPALGWNTLTLLEALTDSAKTSLAVGNQERAEKQLNKVLKVLRQKVKFAKKNHRPLIQRCEYRETKRTRCNKTPIEGIKNGKYLCKYHFNKIEDNTEKLEAFIN
jgi:hypothetical protein